jgi:hypothetical protein
MQLSQIKFLTSRAISKAFFRCVSGRIRLLFSCSYIVGDAYENELKYFYGCKDDRTTIDVGDNEEPFLYIVSKHFLRVYGFEVNDDLTKYYVDFKKVVYSFLVRNSILNQIAY